ncbi:MAG TPA: dTMP kinase [Candidatus Moranbacteria bacterium]|nr:dTMP kinase [Candidatus Moranbacteria bacterium]
MKENKKGKLIVVDGTDGSGKATQVKLLVKRFRKEGHKVKTIDFPQYQNNFFGKLIGQCLAGENGDWVNVNPKVASVLYAADRWESSIKIKKWLKEGFFVVIDRYVSSNQIHQGGKVLNGKKRQDFLNWLDEMEYQVFKIPRPSLIIYLDVPLEHSSRLLKNEDYLIKKKYLNGKKDQHETDLQHQENAKKSALKMVEASNRWVKINCVKKGKLLDRETISDLIWEEIKK